nr:LLM class flavin-dependent oxidoreductase [Nocardioides convexus]
MRVAEDWATVDVLSGGRLNPGFSVGPPMQWEHVHGALYPDTAEAEDFTYTRVERLLALLRGERASSFAGTQGIETFSERVQPHSPGLLSRCWYGGASLASARWAGGQGLNLLTSSVVKAEDHELTGEGDFGRIQRAHIDTFRAAHPEAGQARVSQGLVVIPTDSATPDQRDRYAAYAASRLERTRTPQGPGRLLFAPDLVGPSDESRRAAAGSPGLPGRRRGGLRPALHLRRGRLRPDPHRPRHPARPGAGLEPGGLSRR